MLSILFTYLEKQKDQIRMRRPAVLTEDFRSFFQSFEENNGIVLNKQLQFPSSFLLLIIRTVKAK